jgi:hypothetical protein
MEPIFCLFFNYIFIVNKCFMKCEFLMFNSCIFILFANNESFTGTMLVGTTLSLFCGF